MPELYQSLFDCRVNSHLRAFIEFLDREGVSILEVTDRELRKFRDEEFNRVKMRRNSSSSEKAAQRTVNAKLRRAYLYILWLQEIEHAGSFMIGEKHCQVTSSLNAPHLSGRRCQRDSFQAHNFFPVAFRNAGAYSRHGLQYEATDEDIALLADYFHATCSPYAAQRNILMMDLASQVSWRRGSISSLTCDQFARLAFSDIEHDQLLVVPASQKFGYERAFEVPFRLAFHVSEFITVDRQELLRRKGWTEQRTCGRIFLSERQGTPLTETSISMIFGKAFRAIGRKRGANIHSFRRKFANDLTDQEIATRLDLGLDTGAQSIASSVSLKMGHRSPNSLTPYINSRLTRAAQHSGEMKDARIKALEDENRELKEQLAKRGFSNDSPRSAS